ncbi:hypothetical protein DUW79_21105 [Klebsiella pneumoniae]|nr:hypothetical protein DUW79_21105 [Klebsiella pneumoniae]
MVFIFRPRTLRIHVTLSAHRLSDKLLKSSAASFSLRRGVCILRFPAAESSIYFAFSAFPEPR